MHLSKITDNFHDTELRLSMQLTSGRLPPLPDYEAASSRAGKVENEVKRLHNLIVDINSHKLKAQQDKLDKVNKELDDCSSTITKAQVAIKTAER